MLMEHLFYLCRNSIILKLGFMYKHNNKILGHPRGLISGVFILCPPGLRPALRRKKRDHTAPRRVQCNILPFRTGFVNYTIYKFTCYCTSEEKILAGGKSPFVSLKPSRKPTACSHFGFVPLVMLFLLFATAFFPSYPPQCSPPGSLPDCSSLNQ